jgi:hypothetical protein
MTRWAPTPVLAALVLSLAGSVRAQGTSGPRVSDSGTGYIDPAIPGDILRFRFDAAYNDRVPTRAEFFYPKGAPLGPGLPEPEPRVDYQELSAYLEMAVSDRLSGFLNLPVRFLNPEINADHTGFSDLDAGFKFAFLSREDAVATFQFRTYAPTGDASHGLGTNHVSLEPAFLLFHRLTDRLAWESELRLWVPVGGTDFAGDIVRYGVGAHYDVFRSANLTLAPVAEVVGWTLLNGKESIVLPSGTPFVEDAGGQTIVNAKLGLRVKFGDRMDLYGGYGHPLTGDRWYENILRLEFRLFY